MILKTEPRVRLILPPYELMGPRAPLIFLAGPITHAPNWQAEVVEQIVAKAEFDVDIASPRRMGWAKLGPDEYNEQVDWEHLHLTRAIDRGVTLFWLAKPEIKSTERAYGQTSRFELAEAMMNHLYKRAKVVVGMENGFGNERYIIRTFGKKAPMIPIMETLSDTVDATLSQVYK